MTLLTVSEVGNDELVKRRDKLLNAEDNEVLTDLLSDEKIWGVAEELNTPLDAATNFKSEEYKHLLKSLAATWKHGLEISKDETFFGTEYNDFFEPHMVRYLDEYIQDRIKTRTTEALSEAIKLSHEKEKNGEQLLINFTKNNK